MTIKWIVKNENGEYLQKAGWARYSKKVEQARVYNHYGHLRRSVFGYSSDKHYVVPLICYEYEDKKMSTSLFRSMSAKEINEFLEKEIKSDKNLIDKIQSSIVALKIK